MRTNEEQQEIFSANLQRLIEGSGKRQSDIADDLEISHQLLNSWVRGKRLPRMGKVEMLARYFHVSVAELVNKRVESDDGYYSDIETAEIANRVLNDKDLRVLFDAAHDANPEDIKMAADLLKRLKGTNIDG